MTIGEIIAMFIIGIVVGTVTPFLMWVNDKNKKNKKK